MDIVTSVFAHHPSTGERLGKLLNSVGNGFPDLLDIFRETGERVYYFRRSSNAKCITIAFLTEFSLSYLRLTVVLAKVNANVDAGRESGQKTEVHFVDDGGFVLKSLDDVLMMFERSGHILFSDFKKQQMKKAEMELKEAFGNIHLTWTDVIELTKPQLYNGLRIIVRSASFTIHIWRVLIGRDEKINFTLATQHQVDFNKNGFPFVESSNYINRMPTITRNTFEKLFEETKTATRSIIIGLYNEPLFPIERFIAREIDCSP